MAKSAGGAAVATAPRAGSNGTGASGSSGGGTYGAVAMPEPETVKPFPIEEMDKPRTRGRNVEPADDEKPAKKTKEPVQETPAEEEETTTTQNQTPADDDDARGDEERETQTDDSDDAGEVIDAHLLRQMLDLGYTEADVQEFGSNDALRRVVTAADRRMLNEERASRQRQQQTQGNGQHTGNGQQENRQQQTQQTTAQANARRRLELKLTADNHDPEAIAAFQQLNEALDAAESRNAAYEERLARLEGDNTRSSQIVREIYQDRKIREFDSAVSKLPKELIEILGEGDSLDMERSSSFFQQRDELCGEAEALQQRYAERGKTLSLSKAVEKAAYAKFHDKIQSIARGEIRSKVEKFARQQTQRPTNRLTPPAVTRPVTQEEVRAAEDAEIKEVLHRFKKRTGMN